MFTSEQIIGDIVLVSFKDPKRYVELGITSEHPHHFQIAGYDNIGIWVQHPGILIPKKTKDDKGKPIPPAKMKKEIIIANFLITWDNINTIMHYPGREGYDFPSEFDKHIGFVSQQEE